MRQLLQTWVRETVIDDNLLYKKSAEAQILFLYDLAYLAGKSPQDGLYIISTHLSKSVQLPVVSLELEDVGLQFVMRGNFYNWKLSVLSEKPITDPNFEALFHTTPPVDKSYTGDPLASVYFEGFPSEYIFGYQSLDARRWSAELGSEYDLYTTIFLCLRAAGAKPALQWPTRP